MAIRILSSENITGNLTLSGNQTIGGDLYVTGTSNSNVVISRDNMYVDAGQLYIGADDAATDDTFRQRVTSGSYFIESRKSGTWTNRLQINTAGTLIVQQGMAISGNIDGVGASFIGTAASGAALVTIENNSGSTATSYGLLVIGGGNSSNGRTFEVRDASGNSDLIVKGNGNVGIGTDSPSAPLTVHGQQKWYTTNNDGNELRGFFNPGGSGDPAELSLYQANGTSVGVELRATGNSYLNGGNVGIGTVSPQTNLHINNDTSNSYATLRLEGANRGGIIEMYNQTSYPVSSWTTDQSGNIFFATSGAFAATSLSTKFTILTGGNVGIGTTNPGNLLDVAGDTDISGQLFVQHNGSYIAKLKQLATSMSNATYTFQIDNTAHTSNLSTAGAMSVDVDSGRAFTINGLGNVGIGTNSPQSPLQVNANIYSSIRLGSDYNYSQNREWRFITNNFGSASWGGIALQQSTAQQGNTFATKFGIDINGNVGIGVTSPGAKLDIAVAPSAPWMKLTNEDEPAFNLTTYNNGTNNGSTVYAFKHGLYYGGTENAAIAFYRGPSSVGGFLAFTTDNGTERMRITGAGTTEFKKNVDILTAQNTNILKVRSTSASFTSSILLVDCDRTTTNNTYNLANFTNAGTAKCVITDGGDLKNTNNSYGALSDERLKENIIDATPKLDDLMKVKIKTFNLKGDEQKQIGVVAQELEEVFPGMVSSAKTPDSEDETLYKSVKYSVFVPMLIKAIQELKAEIELLKNK